MNKLIPFKKKLCNSQEKKISLSDIKGTLECFNSKNLFLSPIFGFIYDDTLKYIMSGESSLLKSFLNLIFTYDSKKLIPFDISQYFSIIFLRGITTYDLGILSGSIYGFKTNEKILKKNKTTFVDYFMNKFFNNSELYNLQENIKRLISSEKKCTNTDILTDKEITNINKNLESIVNNYMKGHKVLCTTEIKNHTKELKDNILQKLNNELKKSIILSYLNLDDLIGEIYAQEVNKIITNNNEQDISSIKKTIDSSKTETKKLFQNIWDIYNYCETNNSKILYYIFDVILILKACSREDIDNYIKGLIDAGVDVKIPEYQFYDLKNIQINNYESYLISEIIRKKYVSCPIIPQKNVKYNLVSMSDCNEVLIINLLNIFSYDNKNMMYDRTIFREMLEEHFIFKFLKKYNTLEKCSGLNFHIELIELFSSNKYLYNIAQPINQIPDKTTIFLFNRSNSSIIFKYDDHTNLVDEHEITKVVNDENTTVSIPHSRLEKIDEAQKGKIYNIIVRKDKYYLTDLCFNMEIFETILCDILNIPKCSIYNILEKYGCTIIKKYSEINDDYIDNDGIEFSKNNITYILKINIKYKHKHNGLDIKSYNYIKNPTPIIDSDKYTPEIIKNIDDILMCNDLFKENQIGGYYKYIKYIKKLKQ